MKRGSPRTVSIPSKPGRVLQDLRGTVERGHAAVSIPSKPGRVLQEEYEFAAGAVVHVSIPSKPGRVLQGGAAEPKALAACFNPVQAGKGSASCDIAVDEGLETFQSRPSREGFCKSGREPALEVVHGFNPVQAGKGSASASTIFICWLLLFQSRPSREGFCKCIP